MLYCRRLKFIALFSLPLANYPYQVNESLCIDCYVLGVHYSYIRSYNAEYIDSQDKTSNGNLRPMVKVFVNMCRNSKISSKISFIISPVSPR